MLQAVCEVTSTGGVRQAVHFSTCTSHSLLLTPFGKRVIP